jgi:hypothetical protein
VITLPVSPSASDADIWVQRVDSTANKLLLRSGSNKIKSQTGQDGVFAPLAAIDTLERVSYIDGSIGWLGQHGLLTYQSAPSSGATLTYSSNGDTNGLFYYLGTNQNTTAWVNPFPQLVYSRSGTGSFDNFATMTNRIVDSHPGNTWLETSPWMMVDLGANKTLIPNYVSIRSWINNDRFPRNFKIQGSNNGTTFDDLLTVTNNTTITGSSQWLSLPITGITTAYRYLRYLCTAPGDSNNVIEVALGEWEFYGLFNSN